MALLKPAPSKENVTGGMPVFLPCMNQLKTHP